MFSGKFIKEKLSAAPNMALYYAQCKHHNFDEDLA